MSVKKFITSRFFPGTIRGQLSALVAILVGGIALSIFIYLSSRQETQALTALKNKSEAIAQIASFSASAALFFDDRESLDEVLTSVRQNKDVDYTFVVNQSGQTVSSFQANDSAPETWSTASHDRTEPDNLSIESPIVHNGTEIGHLYLSISTQAVQDALDENRTAIALISLAIFAVGLFFVLIISRIITTPLGNISEIAQQISQGDLTRRTDETSQGEVGQLARAFNSMIDRVEERTRELQQEIQERTRAETALQKSEERLQQIIATNPAVIYTCRIEQKTTGTEYVPTFVSGNLHRLVGYSALETVGNAQWWHANIHPDDIARIDALASGLFTYGHTTLEYRFRSQDGSYRWIQDSQRLNRTPEGTPVELIGSWTDITARKEAEEAHAQAEIELEDQRTRAMHSDRLRSLGEMAAGIAHELNQPLVGVRGLAEHTVIGMARDWELSDDELKSRMERIIEQADRMVHIIQHVRMFAREAGKPEVDHIAVNDVVQSSLDLTGAQFRSHGIALQADLGDNLPLVLANPFSLEEVLLNILNNARDAIEDRQKREDDYEPTVQMRTLPSQNGSAHIDIEIEDNGGGIPEEIQARIFDPFFTTKDPDKGTGLGLSICKSIVEELEGSLSLKVHPGQSTLFTIKLPTALPAS